jgi:transaldolase
VSLWLDDLSRRRLQTGSLKKMIAASHIVGVTSNPATFRTALQDGVAYQQQIQQLAARGADLDTIVGAITTDDVRDATDLFSAVYSRTRGADGRVSVGVDPRLAYDATATIEQAQELFEIICRNNILIDIPATLPGLSAITEVTARGISVNATLVSSLERYSAVMEAYLAGLEQAQSSGRDLSQIRSVASFAISQVDTEIDRRLKAINSPAAEALLGQAGVASTRAASTWVTFSPSWKPTA